MDSRTSLQNPLGGDKIARLGWIVALILLGVSLVLFFRLVDVRNDLTLGVVRDQIRAACTTPGAQNEQACATALQDLYGLLAEIQEGRANPGAVPAAPAAGEASPAATSTPVI